MADVSARLYGAYQFYHHEKHNGQGWRKWCEHPDADAADIAAAKAIAAFAETL